MTLKVAASILVMMAVVGMARLAGRPYQLRVSTLEEWQRLLRHLVPLIEWRRVPLGVALREASHGLRYVHAPMSGLARALEKPDSDFRQAWAAVLEDQAGLWEDDRLALASLGETLGASDVSFQRDHLLAAQADLDRLVGEARLRLSKDGRLFPALISAAGVMVVILVL